MRRVLSCLVALAALASPAAANAATLVVDTTLPESNVACGLSNAFYAANADEPSGGCPAGNGADTVEFNVPLPAKIVLPGLPLQVTGKGAGSKVTVVGPGAKLLTVSGGSANRVFEVGNEEAKTGESGELTLSDLTITEGLTNEIGAGLYVQKQSVARLNRTVVTNNKAVGTGKFVEGAGIMNMGELFVDESTISNNVAESTSTIPEGEANGAGITTSESKVVLENSTVVGNETLVKSVPENGHSRGGGIFVYTLTDFTMRNTTVTGNKAEINAGTENQANGGGLSFFPVPGGTIANSTIAGNSAPLGANLFTRGVGTIRSTILARPIGGANCATEESGGLTSLGYNLDQDGTCGFAATGDQSGVDPLLAPALAANGGPTETLALLNGSPAVDKGIASPGETSDQRGLPRPVNIPAVADASGGDGTDIGAFEVQVPGVEITSGPAAGETVGSADPTFGFQALGASSGFVCSVDGAVASACSSPFQASGLANGSHTFSVAGVGESGYDGPPATRTFAVDVKAAPTNPTTPVEPGNPTNPSQPPKQAQPKATIGSVPTKTTKRRVKIRFSASVAGSTFRCRLDGRKWQRCRSPYTTPKLALGKHTFRLKAVGPTGLTSKVSKKAFRVVAPARASQA